MFAAFASANDEYETNLSQRISNLRAQVRTEFRRNMAVPSSLREFDLCKTYTILFAFCDDKSLDDESVWD